MASRAQTYAGSLNEPEIKQPDSASSDETRETRAARAAKALSFVNLVQQRAPPNFEVQSEVRLSLEPQMVKQNIKDIPGYDEMREKLFDWLSPEERLAGLAPEQRLAGLAPA